MRQKLGILILCVCALSMSACAINRQDRIYLAPHKYKQAKLLYDQVGSLKLTKELLDDSGWRQGEINEFDYRITKELELLETDGVGEGDGTTSSTVTL